MIKLLERIQMRNSGFTCDKCVHFQNNPAEIERAFPGLTAMSSGYASVRDRDGLCSLKQLYLSAGDSCINFNPPR